MLLFVFALIPSTLAVANFAVTSFACSPSEVAVNEQFSCTATIRNSGDSTGTLSSVTLFPDHTSWTEKTSYAVTTSASVNSGATTEITFSNIKGKKTGRNGFARVLLDQVTDTYVADNQVAVNTIDIVALATNSVDSASSGSTVDVTAQANVGGSADVTLTFAVTSGSCTIGNQVASTTITGLTNGQTTTHSWTVTMSSNTCRYTVSAQARSTPSGTATKTDTAIGSITGTAGDSSSGSSGSSSGGSAAGGGGGSSSSTKNTTTSTTTTTTPIPTEEKTTTNTQPKPSETTPEPETPPTPENPRPADKWRVPLIAAIIVVIAIVLYRKYEM